MKVGTDIEVTVRFVGRNKVLLMYRWGNSIEHHTLRRRDKTLTLRQPITLTLDDSFRVLS